MGYTHYWDNVNANDEDWERLCQDAKKVISTAVTGGVKVAFEYDDIDNPPEINDKNIRFNGIEDEGHETFLLDRSTEWTFCKTAQKPYDVVVVAILTLASKHLPGFEWRSDGGQEDHVEGIELANSL